MKFKKIITAIIFLSALILTLLTGCSPSDIDQKNTYSIGNQLSENQPTPTDIEYSLSRYNLIRRLYYINGYTEKAKNLECSIKKKETYIYLFLEGVGCVACDTVDGIVTPLTTYLTPDTFYTPSGNWLPDVDGTYGENNEGIFYFDTNGGYHEWTGPYYYSETKYSVDDPIINNIIESETNN